MSFLQVRELRVAYAVRRRSLLRRTSSTFEAVKGVSFDVARGETLGLVGESGSGKTSTGLALMGLVPTASGSIVLDGAALASLRGGAARRSRRRFAMVFQDPYASLNPRLPVGRSIAEPLEIHRLHDGRRGRQNRVDELLRLVGLGPEHRNRYPHELSGGQRQRVVIARALAAAPELVIADEPIASLDVSLQAQILNLLAELQEELSLTMLFIAHDLAAVQHISDRIAVMYRGRIVEIGDRDELVEHPLHPYTRALLAAVPIPDPGSERGRRAEAAPDAALHAGLDRAPTLVDVGGGHLVAAHALET